MIVKRSDMAWITVMDERIHQILRGQDPITSAIINGYISYKLQKNKS